MKIKDLVNKQLFQDLDGCLADFDKGVRTVTGQAPDAMPQSKMWAYIGNPIIKTNSPTHFILQALAFEEEVDQNLLNNKKAWRQLERAELTKDGEITPLGREAYNTLKKFKNFEVERDFYNTLPWMSDGKELWNFVKKFNPAILTGLPMGNWASPQKFRWCQRELGLGKDRVLVGMARDKAKLASDYVGRPLDGDILIDDREKARSPWIANGGYFILHTSAENTIAQLKGLGFS